jgi:hypothetical protein
VGQGSATAKDRARDKPMCEGDQVRPRDRCATEEWVTYVCRRGSGERDLRAAAGERDELRTACLYDLTNASEQAQSNE